MSIVSLENITKSYGDKLLFDDISFSISEKQRIGLIGVNGTGKSTLLKIIADIESAENGKVIHANKFHIEYLPQHPIFDKELTVLDQIYYGNSPLLKAMREYEQTVNALAAAPNDVEKQKRLNDLQQQMDILNAWEAISVAKTVLTRLGITNFDQPVKELSGGQRKRVAIAKALIQPADLLILDEPTNHLDNETIEWLEGFLAQYKGAILVVTHDRYFLNRVTNRILEIDQGKLYSYDGNYETFLEGKAEREELEIASDRKRDNLLRRELAWLKRGAKARSTKQKARIERVEKLKSQKQFKSNEKLDIAIGANRLGKKVLELKDVNKGFAGAKLINDLNYLVEQGDRLGIIGPNGTGKTTLLDILAGRVKPDTGTVEMGQTVKIGYYTQDYQDMDEDLRVIEYIRETAEIVRTSDGQFITAEQMLERFLFPRSTQWTYIGRLSGGERRRLYLLQTLMEEPNVLFLDEPTNDLDIQTLSILEDYLEQFPGVVITVSHDRYFLDRVVDHLIAFEGHGVIHLFGGNYTEYLEIKKQEKNSKSDIKETEHRVKSKNDTRKKDPPKKLSFKDQHEWDEIEGRIAALEDCNAKLLREIDQAASDFNRVQELYLEQQQVEKDLDQAIERWTELSLLVEEIEQNKQNAR
ncbi:MAG: ABC-F family ATP-binding cassette domain-containing protein [Firmicutes bacterium]|nr:ABC-F family ATP-binding cassette domain-containing protein [Bacillota bacterium]